ncbi:putative nucleotide-diphospho-sugar transferase [Thiomicrorhabdus indica]|uniref:putative nucleotide-diphospho-sugar transferase n=1 Tax=Thiomicrorhabdus indica TaxID=2267253 RepID=UPI002AA601D4|nr:putative nucleotide-diphospho-sugar transferase [Thiomicrorhabdus indica]
MKIVAFTTDDSLYFQHAKLLKASLDKLGLELYLEVVGADEWQKIIAFKPTFIQRVCQKFNEPILYVDADAFVHKDVRTLFSEVEEDIAAHYYLEKEFTTGTLFINNTQAARKLVNEWVEEMDKDPNRWDQKVLEELVEQKLEDGLISIKRLSPEYTYIFDRTPKYYQNIGSPIVEHLQASRESRFKKRYQNKGWLSNFWMTCLLNKQYRKFKYRRDYTAKLAQKVGCKISLSDSV